MDDRFQVIGIDQRSGRITGEIEYDHLGAGREESLYLGRMNAEPLLRVGSKDAHLRTGQLGQRGVGRPERRREYHLVPFFQQGEGEREERLLGPAGDQDFIGFNVCPVLAAVVGGDRFAQLRDPGSSSVMGKILCDRPLSGVFYMLRGGEIRVAGSEVDQIDPGTPELGRPLHHPCRARPGEALYPFCPFQPSSSPSRSSIPRR